MKKSERLKQRIDSLLTNLPPGERRSGGSVSGFATREIAAERLSGVRGGFLPDWWCTTFCNVSNAMIADDCGMEA